MLAKSPGQKPVAQGSSSSKQAPIASLDDTAEIRHLLYGQTKFSLGPSVELQVHPNLTTAINISNAFQQTGLGGCPNLGVGWPWLEDHHGRPLAVTSRQTPCLECGGQIANSRSRRLIVPILGLRYSLHILELTFASAIT
eukprot:5630154-Amphidinium_carterae.1